MRPLRAVQQVQLGTALNTEAQALQTLRLAREAGFEGIELNGFQIRPTPLFVRALTRVSGMPAGRGGSLDWPSLVDESGLAVVAVHEDLGTLERAPALVRDETRLLRTSRVVVTGMYRFDYTDATSVRRLADRLNTVGERLAGEGLRLHYHNHNAEFSRVADGRTAYDLLLEATDPAAVAFELDVYWASVAGVDPVTLMRRLGRRLELCHVTDRGSRRRGVSMSPIVAQDSVELGLGNLDLVGVVEQAVSVDAAAVVLETHRNWVDRSPVRSMQRSADFLNAHL